MTTRLAVIIAILVFMATGAQAANLLTNPGFESHPIGLSHGDGAWWEYDWRYFSVNGASGTFLTVTPGRTGNVAIKITKSGTTGDSGLDRDGFLVPVTAGVRYRASFWAKSPTYSSIKLSLAAHDSGGAWIQQQKEAYFTIGSDYTRYYADYMIPAGASFVNFAMRISGTGTVYIDDCELDIATVDPLTTPTITYPVNETIDSFKPTIGFKGPGHDAYQAIISRDSSVVWDSGTVVSGAFSLTSTLNLLSDSSYKVKVRVRRGTDWSDYSPESDFTTPGAPIVRIVSPAEADSVLGNKVNSQSALLRHPYSIALLHEVAEGAGHYSFLVGGFVIGQVSALTPHKSVAIALGKPPLCALSILPSSLKNHARLTIDGICSHNFCLRRSHAFRNLRTAAGQTVDADVLSKHGHGTLSSAFCRIDSYAFCADKMNVSFAIVATRY